MDDQPMNLATWLQRGGAQDPARAQAEAMAALAGQYGPGATPQQGPEPRGLAAFAQPRMSPFHGVPPPAFAPPRQMDYRY